MFKKLISNLPFNPSLLSQVSFYAKRVNQEASVRRMGFGLIALAMFIQMFAVIAPPEKSLAASDNHIINGLRTKSDILAAWDRAGSDIPSIYGKFGLTRTDIEKLPNNPNTTLKSNSGPDWWTIGRNSLSNYSNVNYLYKLTEVALQTGPTTVYMRQLRAWDIKNPFNTYSAFTGTKSDGTQFWILVDCGNYTQVGKFTPKPPALDVRKSIVGNPATLKPGDTMTYRLEYRNKNPDSLAENAVLRDDFDLANYNIISPTNLTFVGNVMQQPVGNLSYSATYHVLDITVRLKNPFPATDNKTCNNVSLSAGNATSVNYGPVCIVVPPPTPTQPKLICSLVDTDLDKATRVATLKTTVTSTDEKSTKIFSYVYNFGDNTIKTQKSTAFTDTIKHTYLPGVFDASVTIAYTVVGEPAGTIKNINCSAPIEFEADKPLGQFKKVKNITQNLEGDKAVGAIVKAGDVLEYTLVTANTQSFERKGYVVTDYVGDILDYANVDLVFLKTQGGLFDETTKKISWPAAAIPAGSEIKNTFRIIMKNPLPATNTPSAVSGSFDCKISNKYGNDITMSVNCPTVKGLETLPNAGPGTSLIMGFTITTIVGYFFARSRLLSKELAIIRSDYAPAGGF